MRRRRVLAIIAANAIVLVALAFLYPHLMVAPGALAAGHADLATDCFACHAPFRGASAGRCMTCHAVADIGATSAGTPGTRKASFHRELISPDCMACHTDHAAPRLAGRPSRPFDHGLLGPADATHCASCHAPPDIASHRGLGTACATCHRPDAWSPARFDHGRYFVLDRHHNTTCVTCHAGGDLRRHTCYGCHEHAPAAIRARHLEEGIFDVGDCVACHRSASGPPRRGDDDD